MRKLEKLTAYFWKCQSRNRWTKLHSRTFSQELSSWLSLSSQSLGLKEIHSCSRLKSWNWLRHALLLQELLSDLTMITMIIIMMITMKKSGESVQRLCRLKKLLAKCPSCFFFHQLFFKFSINYFKKMKSCFFKFKTKIRTIFALY